jgi:alpha-L-fucosidase
MNPILFKRCCMLTLLCTGLTITLPGQQNKPPLSVGPYAPTEESLKKYQFPEWFRDAKFGIWSHWGPQAVPRQGDWYARKMYQEGGDVYKYHVEHYGHPSVFGFKDIIPLWKAQKWDPEKLMALYKKAGAKYFVSMATHHDNFFLWNSKINNWNSVNMGPLKDVVGLWQKAAKNQGLRFGVSEHLGASYTWYQPAHGSDKQGPGAGIPYDGAFPDNQELYHADAAPDDNDWLTVNKAFQLEWYRSIKELIDNYQPDLIYSDSKMPFENIGRTMVSHFYNQDYARHKGQVEAVYTCKQKSDGWWVEDLERGVKDTAGLYPWQTDTSIGDWYYRTDQKYKTSTEVIQMLVDIVSKNGNLLINVVQTPEGDLEPDMLKILEEIGAWTSSNGDGIYGTRPWKVYGEKPAGKKALKLERFDENFGFTSHDIRYTSKGNVLYAYCLGKPDDDIQMRSLGKSSKLTEKPVGSVSLIGSDEKLNWKQTSEGLLIRKPLHMPEWQVIGFKIEFKK